MKETNDQYLLGEFRPVSAREWKLKIQADLKGRDYQSLITHTPEGIDIRPFYHADEFKALPAVELPARYKIVSWHPPLQSPGDMASLLEREVEAVDLILDDAVDPGQWQEWKGTVRWYAPVEKYALAEEMLREGHEVWLDPLGRLARRGAWTISQEEDLTRTRHLLETYSGARLHIDGTLFADAGAHAVQQLAYMLAVRKTYAQYLGARWAAQARMDIALGSRYFVEIAKLRALRFLTGRDFGGEVKIWSRPTLRNKTILDPYTNMLRTGMEMMAAVLGGSDEIANLPYDYLFADRPESYRLADNQLILLREEASFETHRRATEGSYFIEEWTWHLANKAAELAGQIEKGGGWLKQLYDGTVQRHIRRTARLEQERFDRGESVLIGVNKYLLAGEEIPRPLPRAFVHRQKRRTLFPPVVPVRLAEKTERERLKEQGIEI